MLWDLNESKHLYSLNAGDVIHSLVFSPNRYWLCAATASNIIIFDLEKKSKVDELKPEFMSESSKSRDPECVSLAWSADGQTLFAGEQKKPPALPIKGPDFCLSPVNASLYAPVFLFLSALCATLADEKPFSIVFFDFRVHGQYHSRLGSHVEGVVEGERCNCSSGIFRKMTGKKENKSLSEIQTSWVSFHPWL
jgi:hypothetical protein